ncbi:hypothetical protein P389DRAFT_188281 [Cystobasidium minutum MCA 4210]|uniref:uncharacterized protein n=1 Tax=Cystobasidium minutum MCA 4210 TaxID=1397322 RepID=UPI0034CE1734|eukprot:jgi/Rhomi1/188281/estExt_fgenesh1_pg.C_2_t20105
MTDTTSGFEYHIFLPVHLYSLPVEIRKFGILTLRSPYSASARTVEVIPVSATSCRIRKIIHIATTGRLNGWLTAAFPLNPGNVNAPQELCLKPDGEVQRKRGWKTEASVAILVAPSVCFSRSRIKQMRIQRSGFWVTKLYTEVRRFVEEVRFFHGSADCEARRNSRNTITFREPEITTQVTVDTHLRTLKVRDCFEDKRSKTGSRRVFFDITFEQERGNFETASVGGPTLRKEFYVDNRDLPTGGGQDRMRIDFFYLVHRSGSRLNFPIESVKVPEPLTSLMMPNTSQFFFKKLEGCQSLDCRFGCFIEVTGLYWQSGRRLEICQIKFTHKGSANPAAPVPPPSLFTEPGIETRLMVNVVSQSSGDSPDRVGDGASSGFRFRTQNNAGIQPVSSSNSPSRFGRRLDR